VRKSSAKHLERLLADELLSERIDLFIAELGEEFPLSLVAKALTAKALDLSLAEVGALPTISMIRRAADLLGGRWTPESIEMFIKTENY
jgi:hypothetical protein